MSKQKSEETAEPFLRWAGGKRQLLPVFTPYFIDIGRQNKFIEPFVGAGTIFFNFNAHNNVLNDINTELMNCYNVMKDDVMYKKLIVELRKPKYKNTEKDFHFLRDRYNEIRKNKKGTNNIEKVALFVYLNCTCFNGLYRENKDGDFNTSYGKRFSLQFPEACIRKLKQARDYIQDRNLKLYNGHYSEVLKTANKGDFVYLDPPYHPLNANSFTKYNKGDFTPEDQNILIDWCDKLDQKGCYVMYSNSNTSFIKSLFRKLKGKWYIKELNVKRYISCDSDTRSQTANIELLVTNYKL
jgi:DNA adenine methylase